MRAFWVLAVAILVGCAGESVTLPGGKTSQLPPSFLDPIQFDTMSDVAIQPVSIRMQPTGRRDYTLRIQQTITSEAFSVEMDISYSGFSRVRSRPDGRTVFSIYVDNINGTLTELRKRERQSVSYSGAPIYVVETAHNADNSLYELSLPLLGEMQRREKSGAVGAVALLLLSDNLWPLYPVRASSLSVGKALWPENAREIREMFQNELGPALLRSRFMKDLFDEMPAQDKRLFRSYEHFGQEVSQRMATFFVGDGSNEMSLGGRVSGARVWKGQDVLEAYGPMRFRGKVGLGKKQVSINLEGNHHVLVDPFSGLTVRTEFSATGQFRGGGQSGTMTQRISSQIAPPADAMIIPKAPITPAAPIDRGGKNDIPRGDLPQDATARSISEIYTSSIDAIFTVRTRAGTGSGFLIAPDLVLTNRHVVEDVGSGDVELLQRGRVVAVAKVERTFSGSADMALVRLLRPHAAPPLKLARENPNIGSQVLIIGSPVGLEGSITGGMVSQLRMIGDSSYLQVDAAINPGNSGGPVFDRAGRVVGIATARLEPRSQSGGPQIIGIGFALSAEVVRQLLGSALVSWGHPYSNDSLFEARDLPRQSLVASR